MTPTPPIAAAARGRSCLAALLLAALAALAATAPLSAQTPASSAKKELSERVGAGLGRLRPLLDAKDYAGALVAIEPLLATSAPDSYDRYVLTQIQAQLLLTLGRLTDAIAPLETALRLGDTNPAFVEADARREQLNILAQLHYQRAAELKDPAAQRAGYETALAYQRRWRQIAARPTTESALFTASLLYQLGTLDPAKPDPIHIREAITEGRAGLRLSAAPPAQLLLILVACHLQLGENAPAADLLELLVQRDPASPTNWAQLQSIYLAEAAETKDPAANRRNHLRALLTLERAQAHGHLSTPRDHYTRVAILFNLQQYARAAALLEKGLADGTIESTKRNWELLAAAYQQLDQTAPALSALERAAAKFPSDGALEFSLAQSLYNAGQLEPAYTRAQSALAKGIEKPGQVQVYLAFLAYELRRLEDASRWIELARASGDVPASTLDPLAAAIAEALRARA